MRFSRSNRRVASLLTWRPSEARLCVVTALLCAPLTAGPMPTGYFHGEMVSYESGDATDEGQLTAKDEQGDEYTCSYDRRSYFEYKHKKVKASNLLEGDPLLILVDRTSSYDCYVRVVHVEVPDPKLEMLGLRKTGVTRAPSAPDKPKRSGRATYTQVQERRMETVGGVVAAISDGGILLHTRDGDRLMRITNATRYLNTGRATEPDALSVNQRVSVEVGLDANKQPVALQVSWGSILRVP